ncbi:MAG: tRNA (5-methylaminomethyl-2-thiouridine)(34)-methyltransferase MnmD [Porphyromonas sp.]|nr:tRNA (5-methylaminomethyl-2-thiouridine)(34)-methyltransferase MnmD [Porphyromonas sp.]
MEEKNISLIETSDGSHTILIDGGNESYHSINGAITEAKHVYIHAGLEHYLAHSSKSTIRIGEIGFGMGLNAVCVLEYALAHPELSFELQSIEYDPLPIEVLLSLNYAKQLGIEEKYVEQIVRAEWNKRTEILPNMSIIKEHADALEFEFENESIDVLFFDPFAPDKIESPLWSIPFFRRMNNYLKVRGVLTTYCAKGVVRRGLQEAGFQVERLPGPPGKREILRATKL